MIEVKVLPSPMATRSRLSSHATARTSHRPFAGRRPRGGRGAARQLTDPDAPRGPFTHWLVTGFDPSSADVERGKVPAGGTEHTNDFGRRRTEGRVRHPGLLIATSSPLRRSTQRATPWRRDG
jgi:phosphatidylethanolamine-binding protein (PEBP) family uncharacterized protein